MSLLRRAHAHHRDLQARTDTDVARATKGAGRMTCRALSITAHHRGKPADPARTACARLLPARQGPAIAPTRAALPGNLGRVRDRISHLARHQPRPGSSRGPERTNTFPIASSKTPAASSFRGLSTRAATSRPPTSRRGPHRKTFRERKFAAITILVQYSGGLTQ